MEAIKANFFAKFAYSPPRQLYLAYHDGNVTLMIELVRRLLTKTGSSASAEEGRARERHRRVVQTALASALSKILSVGVAIVSIPLTLNYLGTERFGLWMTLSSLVALLAFADFGIGNGLLNLVSTAFGKDDIESIRVNVSSAYCVLTAVAAFVLMAFVLVYGITPWTSIFNVSSPLAQIEVGPAIAVFVACFSVGIPLSIIHRVQAGLQLGFTSALWQCVASTLSLVGVLTAIHFEASLAWLVLALMGSPLIASFVNTIVFFTRTRSDLRPSLRLATTNASQYLLRVGALFFLLQIVAAISYASDSMVIARLLGAAAVAEYAVPERMFSIVALSISMFLTPLWPAYGEALSRGDKSWVQTTIYRSLRLAIAVASTASILLVLASPYLLDLWVKSTISPPLGLLVALAVWKTIEAAGSGLAAFLNGAGIVRAQVYMAIGTALFAISGKLILVERIGLQGAVLATIIAYVSCTLVPSAIIVPRFLRKLSQSS